MLLIDGDRFIDFNPATLKMLGYQDREELMARHPSSFSPPYQPDGRASKEKANEMIGIALVQGSHRFEWTHRRANGEDFPVEVALTSIPNFLSENDTPLLHVVWRDITDQKKAEEKLLLAKAAIDATGEGIIITDLTPKIIDVNPAYCEITGYDRSEAIGRNPNFTRSEHHPAEFFEEMWDTISSEGFWCGEIWDRRKTGEVFPKFVRINTITDDTGLPIYYVGVFSDISDQKKTEARLEELAFCDALTGLPNRALFHQRLQMALADAQRRGSQVGLLFIDLDHFKRVNDTMGHSHGDLLLKKVAKNLQGALRATDTVARMGGDEFTIILPDVANDHIIADIAGVIANCIREPIELNGHNIHPSGSIGIAVYPRDGQTIDELTRHADLAMYKAKEKPGSAFRWFSESMNRETQKRLMTEHAIRNGIQNQEFIPYYQPIINLDTGNITEMEALIRWNHPKKGLVGPGDFITFAEEMNLIRPMGLNLLRDACTDARIWNEAIDEPLKLSVNLSPCQFQGGTLASEILNVLDETGLAPKSLMLEITESTLMENMGEAVSALCELRKAGIVIAIDDFGTGYSSLNHLRELPIDVLKIDRSFIANIHRDEAGGSIVRTIVSLAENLNLKVVAEGVETLEQAEELAIIGCVRVQGFYFSRPVDRKSFADLLAQGPCTPDPTKEVTPAKIVG